MELSEVDKAWNEMVTLLNSDDREEREQGIKLREELCSKWPNVCEMVKEQLK
ncbi:MAG: hypothetical protein E6713_18235 [Sporomusaceae bacterium]|nr:hypothetical protein [Sporomusaceae bacterium]